RYDYDDNEDRGNDEASTIPITARDSFRFNTFSAVIDSVTIALKDRISAYTNVYNRFKVVLSSDSLNDTAVEGACMRLAMDYPSDLCALSFAGEMCQFLAFVTGRG